MIIETRSFNFQVQSLSIISHRFIYTMFKKKNVSEVLGNLEERINIHKHVHEHRHITHTKTD